MKPEFSQGPELNEIIEDYYLPLNAIKRAHEYEDRNTKRYHGLQENVYETSDGMSKELYYQLVNYLANWELPKDKPNRVRRAIKHQAVQYELHEGELYKKAKGEYPRRKVVQSQDVLKILQQHHDHMLAGHQGVVRTFDAIKNKYYWSGYYDTVRRYVLSCQVCQNFAPKSPPVPLHLNPRLPHEGPFTHIMMDYIYLPLTKNGNCSALVLIGCFTGWIECIPTPSQNSSLTCIALFEWICQFGIMTCVHVDNGKHFNSEEVKVMMVTYYGIELSFGVPFRPRGQGKVERANGVSKKILKKYALS